MSSGTPRNQPHHIEATRTYIEQTKLLVALASAFVVVPAAAKVTVSVDGVWYFVVSEVCLVASVLCGYVVFGTIAGSQDEGDFNVYRPATRSFSLAQIALFLVGLAFFVALIWQVAPPADDV